MIRSTFTLRPNHIRDLHEIINRPIPNAGAQLYRGVFTRDGAYQRPNSGDDNSTARVNTEPAGGVCVTPVAFEVTLFVNNAGPLSKHVFLDPDGSLIKIPYAQMWCGTMARRPLSDLHAFARLIEDMPRNAAIALGAKQEGLLDCDQLVLSDDLRDGQPGFASRSQKNIAYRREKPALVLLDFDDGGMPSAVKTRLEELGGFLGAVKYLCHDITTSRHHDITTSGYVHRPSTSANIINGETEQFYPSAGQHLFALIKDGSDAQRFLKALASRAWQEDLGWFVISEDGKLLERSIIDVAVAAPERLVFEANADVDPPLRQEPREAHVHFGPPLNSWIGCPDLGTTAEADVKQIKSKAARDLAPEASRRREAFDKVQIAAAVKRGVPLERARQMVEHRGNGILTPDVELEFDDPHIGKNGLATVRDVLADPARFANQTLRAPGEDHRWGPNKAIVLRSGLTIFAFTPNGDVYYRLRHDYQSIKAAIMAAPKDEAPDVFFWLVLNGITNKIEEDKLVQLVKERAGVGVRPIQSMLKQERTKQRAEEAQATRIRQRAKIEKICLEAPSPDAEAGPVMIEWDSFLCRVKAPEPPMRDMEGWPVTIRFREAMGLHELTSNGANAEENETSRLPAPKQFLLTKHDIFSLEIEIGDYITFMRPTSDGERAVCPPERLITHYLKYMRSALPTVRAVVTMPLVLPNGDLLASNGLDRERRLVMRIDPALLGFIPKAENCTPEAVDGAFRFLVDQWLVDVSTDLKGKCTLIAFALSIIERTLFAERPVWFNTAGKRGGGKTTVLIMLVLAVTGIKPPAAAWAVDSEERRKAILAYLMEGLAALIWDNIPRGTMISCSAIERASTAETYTDRILGLTKVPVVPAQTIMAFTGNNIGPKGEIASRALMVELDVDRPDPENRPFKHSDPIGWTRDHRGEILRALYTILLGNPQFDAAHRVPAPTRFKPWWNLVGSAVENPACRYAPAQLFTFKDMFAQSEEGDEETASFGEILGILYTEWPEKEFASADVAAYLKDRNFDGPDESKVLRCFCAPRKPGAEVTADSIGKALKAIGGAPVAIDASWSLKMTVRTINRSSRFTVVKIARPSA